MARFASIPQVPEGATEDWEIQFLNSMKENIELLTGDRGLAVGAAAAVLRGDVDVSAVPPGLEAVGARASGFTIGGEDVAGLEEFSRLITDVQSLTNDVRRMRDTLNLMIRNMRGG